MSLEGAWISSLKREFQKSPLLPNVFFSFILLCLEKLVEVEFVCPCNPESNHRFAVTYFAVPAVAVFLLMVGIRCRKSNCCQCFTAVCSSSIPSLVWLILMFLDGRYYVCDQSDWSGRFVVVAEAAPQKWCKPTNQTSSEELMKKSQEWASDSQEIGMWLLFVATTVLTCTIFYKRYKGE